MLKAVFFDAFGTLLNADGLHLRATEEILALMGLEGLDAREVHEAWDRHADSMWGSGSFMPLRDLFREALRKALSELGFEPGPGDLSKAISILVRVFEEGTRPYDGALEVLSFCRELDLKTGLISDADSELLRTILAKFGLSDHLDVVIISDEVGSLKPDEDIFHVALSAAGCEPEEALMVGDSLRDLAGARKVGMAVALVLRPGRPSYDVLLRAPAPDIIVSDLRELEGPIMSMSGQAGPSGPKARLGEIEF